MTNIYKYIFCFVSLVVVFPTAIFAAPISKNPLLTKEGAGGGHLAKEPVRVDKTEIESKIHAAAYVVIDQTSGKILTMKQENLVWPIASLTKLMTAQIVLRKATDVTKVIKVTKADDVGGAKLYIQDGDSFTTEDLLYAMLVGSANNAANALARLSGLSKEDFVKAMNEKAKTLGLIKTAYVDPSGIDPANVSTPLEFAKIAQSAFNDPLIKKYASQPISNVRVTNTGTVKKIQNTNWMLTKPAYQNGIVVAGKTGYLEESKWNFVTAIRPKNNDAKKELLLVLLGSDSRQWSFEDAKTLSNWAWKVYKW